MSSFLIFWPTSAPKLIQGASAQLLLPLRVARDTHEHKRNSKLSHADIFNHALDHLFFLVLFILLNQFTAIFRYILLRTYYKKRLLSHLCLLTVRVINLKKNSVCFPLPTR